MTSNEVLAAQPLKACRRPGDVGRECRAVLLAAHRAMAVGHRLERARDLPRDAATQTASTNHRHLLLPATPRRLSSPPRAEGSLGRAAEGSPERAAEGSRLRSRARAACSFSCDLCSWILALPCSGRARDARLALRVRIHVPGRRVVDSLGHQARLGLGTRSVDGRSYSARPLVVGVGAPRELGHLACQR